MLRPRGQLRRRARPLRRVGGRRRDRAAAGGARGVARRGRARRRFLLPHPAGAAGAGARPASGAVTRATTRRFAVTAFVPPPYPYERLDEVVELAGKHEGGAVDLSIGTPCDAPPPEVLAALVSGDTARGYPPSIGSPQLRRAAAGWIERRLGATVDPATEIAACVGTKEFVASVPQYLKLRDPARD